MIHLLVPGLLGPFPRFAEAGEAPRLPALETLLARGGSIAEVAFALFGVDADPAATAALCHAADAGGVEASRVLLHAHLIWSSNFGQVHGLGRYAAQPMNLSKIT